MKRVIGLFVLLIVLSIGFLSADFESGNLSHSIEKKYSIGSVLKGWINISLSEEPISSLFETGFNGDITVLKLLDLNSADKNCIPTDCQSDYSSVPESGELSKTLTLNNGETKILGFEFKGDFSLDSISSFSANITSNASESTVSQLLIELAKVDENNPEWRAYKGSGNYYLRENQGCYDGTSSGEAEITEVKLCNRISIPPAPSVELGANIKTNNGGESNIVFSIEETEDQCSVTVTSEGRKFCTTELKSTKLKEYLVCIEAVSGSQNYKLDYETNNPCGKSGTNEGFDFDIFANPGEYEKVGSFILNNTELDDSESFVTESGNVEDYIENYVKGKYDDCSGGCIVPIKFISNVNNQQITISDISISYFLGVPETTHEIHNVTGTIAKVSTDEFQQLYLDEANFSVPGSFGNHTLELSLDEEEIFSERIFVEKAPSIKSVNPKTVPAAYPSKFTVDVDTFNGNTTIEDYEWDFGDGGKETTVVNTATHTYSTIGNFKLKITATDSNNVESSRTFDISVKSPKDAVNFLLTKKINDLDTIKSQIEAYPSFYQSSLNDILKLETVEPKLGELQEREATASSDQDYVNIMSELVELKVPESVNVTQSADSFLFYTDKNEINVNAISEIDGSSYDVTKEDLYQDAILSWSFSNAEMNVDFREFSGVYEDYTDEILNIFEVSVEENLERNNSFLFIPKLDNLKFGGNYGEEETSGYYYIEITGDGKKVSFSTSEEVDLFELPVFISPRIGQFSYVEFGKEERERLSRQTVLILSLLLIVFIGFIAYIAMQEWYKRKYEAYLFKNRNDLYNLISYIQSATKRGLDNKNIANRLKKIGWGQEQINYVLRKYSGKRTGMFEIIPLGKIIDKLNKNKASGNEKKLPDKNNRFNGARKI